MTRTTTGTITGIHCIIVRPGACGNATTFNSTGSTTGEGITLSGSIGGTYGNTSQQLTILAAGQSLNAKWSSTACLQGTGTGTAIATFGPTGGGNVVFSPAGSEVIQITN